MTIFVSHMLLLTEVVVAHMEFVGQNKNFLHAALLPTTNMFDNISPPKDVIHKFSCLEVEILKARL